MPISAAISASNSFQLGPLKYRSEKPDPMNKIG
jgi:hypothetical protein